ncbi:MAG: hypothetical protein HN377_11680 [Alphaproteobacteria bacterium]|nr:hypothetical protein [Alphaproteobacteria bacterium]MBT7942569.1 hypothetical protein [Alphaproteobacteria bacterium]
MGNPSEKESGILRREWFLSFGAMVLAFLASQHHNLHMVLLSIGLGGAGTSFVTTFPLVRRGMLLLSLAMVAMIGYRMCGAKRPRSMRIAGAISIIITLGLAVWSVMQFGL